MKKLVAVSILLTLLTAGAFAQFSVGVYADFYPNLVRTTTPYGDFADDTRAAIYEGAGTFDVFSSDGPFHGNELRLSLGYTDPEKKYGGLLVIAADSWLNRDNEYFQSGVSSDIGINRGNGQSLLDLFAQPFDEWNVWGEVGVLKGFAGTSADRGPAGGARYNDPFAYSLDNLMMYNNGIIAPDGYIDTYNLGKFAGGWIPAGGGRTEYKDAGRPYVSVTANLAPLKVAVSGDVSNITGVGNTSYNEVGAALRVSGEKIADLISFDAIYKIYGGDPETDQAGNLPDQPDGLGLWGHNFGLIANVSLFDTLGITAGYSGYAYTREKDTNTSQTYVYPYYNGIDLRVDFSGVDKLLVSFNNNISFSTFKGDNDQDRDYGVDAVVPYRGWNDATDVSAGYLGLYNGLGVKYNITDSLFATLNLANLLKSTTVTDESGTDTITTVWSEDTFRAYAGAGYAFGDHVLLETGLVFDVGGESLDISNASAASYNGGTFTFAIPIRFKVAF
ncbi:MAG: hypothetical protein LBG57_09970 [Treponema sp.]|jgi:hypothetical protein|nr:hypothetical protein [Treponema sp.]